MVRRHEWSEEQWQRIEHLLPPETGRPGPRGKPNRVMVNGMIWILRTGAPERDLPRHYGRWESVYTRFLRGSKRGIWKRVHDELSKDFDDEYTIIDGSNVRVHQDAVGGKKRNRVCWTFSRRRYHQDSCARG